MENFEKSINNTATLQIELIIAINLLDMGRKPPYFHFSKSNNGSNVNDEFSFTLLMGRIIELLKFANTKRNVYLLN